MNILAIELCPSREPSSISDFPILFLPLLTSTSLYEIEARTSPDTLYPLVQHYLLGLFLLPLLSFAVYPFAMTVLLLRYSTV